MKKLITTIILGFCFLNIFAFNKDVFFGKKGHIFPYLIIVEIEENIASIEVIHNYYTRTYTEIYSEKIKYNKNHDTIYASNRTKIFYKKEKLFVTVFNDYYEFTTKLERFEKPYSELEYIRNACYHHDIQNVAESGLDSLLGVGNYKIDYYRDFMKNRDIWELESSLNSQEFQERYDVLNDSALNLLVDKEINEVQHCYIVGI